MLSKIKNLHFIMYKDLKFKKYFIRPKLYVKYGQQKLMIQMFK
jgi:hypothetical protein